MLAISKEKDQVNVTLVMIYLRTLYLVGQPING